MKVTNEQAIGRDVARNFRQLASELETATTDLASVDARVVALEGVSAGVRARPTGAQSTTSGANTILNWANDDYDTDAFHDNVTNNSRLTVPTGKGGKYIVGYSVLFAGATQTASTWVLLNGGTTRFAWQQVPNDSTNGVLNVGVDVLALNAGDYVQVQSFQNSGGAVNVNGNTSCSFWMHRIHA